MSPPSPNHNTRRPPSGSSINEVRECVDTLDSITLGLDKILEGCADFRAGVEDLKLLFETIADYMDGELLDKEALRTREPEEKKQYRQVHLEDEIKDEATRVEESSSEEDLYMKALLEKDKVLRQLEKIRDEERGVREGRREVGALKTVAEAEP
ncbi:hypothetical protein BU26DRAFT_567764 [Trematosphaeria pertusa]|uniref:Uncharacterized protein n=1 Tax=Trematosphaeria pertusa TaxID=390896 RepID=A0A6A6I870_9PLEO|nr:uncharacterized protein BU26DRAFT_567764 [Trematosphaeria pertusa]KAF2246278.1 hypothetical protein BU26DRAFT_567764 [Trematosphaeria pertusa]